MTPQFHPKPSMKFQHSAVLAFGPNQFADFSLYENPSGQAVLVATSRPGSRGLQARATPAINLYARRFTLPSNILLMAIDDYAALAKDGDCVSGVGRILIIRPDRSMGGYVLRHIAREIFFREYNIPDPWTVALENKRHYNDDNMRVLNSLQSLSNDFVDVDHANGLLSILHQSGDTTPGYSVFDVPMTLLAKRPGTGEETSFSCTNLQGLIAQLAAAKDFGFSLVCVVINHDWKKSETL